MTSLRTVRELLRKPVSSSVKDSMALRIRDLGYDWSQFTLSHFIEWLSVREKRRFICIPFAMPPELFGAWFSNEHRTEFIFYEAHTSAVHQAHIMLHELSHYLLDHSGTILRDSDLYAIQSDPTGKVALEFLQRHVRYRGTVSRDSKEQEAETFCSLMQEQVVRHARMNELIVQQEAHLTVSTYLEALELV
jgi:Zn-dependent peptidase ImmA (M78 family)